MYPLECDEPVKDQEGRSQYLSPPVDSSRLGPEIDFKAVHFGVTPGRQLVKKR